MLDLLLRRLGNEFCEVLRPYCMMQLVNMLQVMMEPFLIRGAVHVAQAPGTEGYKPEQLARKNNENEGCYTRRVRCMHSFLI
jgi:hypothetical protein